MQPLKSLTFYTATNATVFKLPKNIFIERMEFHPPVSMGAGQVWFTLHETFGKSDVNAATDFPLLGEVGYAVVVSTVATQSYAYSIVKNDSFVHRFAREPQILSYVDTKSGHVTVWFSEMKLDTTKERFSLS